MKKRQEGAAFTVVELIIVVVVLAVLAAIAFVSYNGITRATRAAAAQSDLKHLGTAMERELQNNSAYPSALPASITPSENTSLTIAKAGTYEHYSGLTVVQNGVLLADICEDLIAEGIGIGINGGGDEEDYISACGNWNDNFMQFTAWDSKKFYTPVNKATLLDYANNFHANTQYNVDQERVVQEFYGQLVERFETYGGTFPITSFWDYWATPSNGGVMYQSLDGAKSKTIPYFCAESSVNGAPDLIWHITQEDDLLEGGC